MAQMLAKVQGANIISTAGVTAGRRYLAKKHQDIAWDFEKPDRLVKQLSDRKFVLFISMKSWFNEYREVSGRKVIHSYDGHLNQQGHKLVAAVLYSEVSRLFGDFVWCPNFKYG